MRYLHCLSTLLVYSSTLMLNLDSSWGPRLDDSPSHRQIALGTIHGQVSRDSPASVFS